MNVGLLALLVPLAAAQSPSRPLSRRGAARRAAAVLAARVLAPEGVRVTAYPGPRWPARSTRRPRSPSGRGTSTGFELTNLPEHPGPQPLPGSRGPRHARAARRAEVHGLPGAAAVHRRRTSNGCSAARLVTKVVYLEDPEKAVPAAARPDVPIEFPADTEEDAVKAAPDNGRLVAVLRLGDRPAPAERAPRPDGRWHDPAPGRCTTWPRRRPRRCCPGSPARSSTRSSGRSRPTEECILDGGDRGDRLGIGPDGRLGGLDPTDVGGRVHRRRQTAGDELERRLHLHAAVRAPARRTDAPRPPANGRPGPERAGDSARGVPAPRGSHG